MRLVLLQFMTLCFVVNAAASDDPTTIRLTNGEWAPYQSEHLPEYGAASQLVTAAFKAAGIEVEYGFFPWNRAMLLVKQGHWDGTFMWVLTPERERDYLISDPLFVLREVVFYSKANPISAEKPEDLKGKTMGVLDSSAFGRQFGHMVENGAIDVASVPNNQQLFQMLALGRIDFVPELETSGYDAVLEHLTAQQQTQINHLESITYPWSYHLLISRRVEHGAFYIEAFNRGMAALKENGQFERIIGPFIRPKTLN